MRDAVAEDKREAVKVLLGYYRWLGLTLTAMLSNLLFLPGCGSIALKLFNWLHKKGSCLRSIRTTQNCKMDEE